MCVRARARVCVPCMFTINWMSRRCRFACSCLECATQRGLLYTSKAVWKATGDSIGRHNECFASSSRVPKGQCSRKDAQTISTARIISPATILTGTHRISNTCLACGLGVSVAFSHDFSAKSFPPFCLPSSGPPPSPGGSCNSCKSSSELQVCATIINKACCEQPNQHCRHGNPTTCDASCGGVLLHVQSTCHDLLAKDNSLHSVQSVLDSAVIKCNYGGGGH